eukprot:gnl/TRDRNA2_/TRDRNA2_172624_c0_seq1.p1 gnl/TRDRNA2_/TRDRNA2_172624_c0~~gnl/TRDRNA2_/TRDRNA2_172624_c0_seq1.p1  ORF type:complete len:683 (+),score=131.40 gnl/TRDRNA2_/TRDRNA2_172624_c0_seq1:289-2049(+)
MVLDGSVAAGSRDMVEGPEENQKALEQAKAAAEEAQKALERAQAAAKAAERAVSSAEKAVTQDAATASLPETTTAKPANDDAVKNDTLLDVKVYYETQCPYSMALLKDIMAVYQTDIFEFVNFTFYPFGNAMAVPLSEVSTGYKFWHPETTDENKSWTHVFKCQHGEMECLGNRIQMCAQKLANGTSEKFFPFVGCMARAQEGASIEKTSFECANSTGVDLDAIQECTESAEGNRMMAGVANSTKEARASYTPWVTLNGVHAVSAENGLLTKLLCTALLGKGHHPKACHEIELVQLSSQGTKQLVRHGKDDRSHSQTEQEPTTEETPVQSGGNSSFPNEYEGEKLRLAVYYESQCPYSMMALKDLDAIWSTDFRHYINLSMYPFGNAQAIPLAQVSDGYKYWHPETKRSNMSSVFICQHGEPECLGNLIHACAMETTNHNPDMYVPYFACMAGMAKNSVEQASYDCSEPNGIDIEAIKNCTESVEANQKMQAIAEASTNVTLQRKYVPWITLNGVHAVSAENGFLRKLLCTAVLGLSIPLPQACNSIELLQTELPQSAQGQMNLKMAPSDTNQQAVHSKPSLLLSP